MKIAEYFTTSDGQEFYKEDTARNHAKTLANKNIILPGQEIHEAVDVNNIDVEAEELDGIDHVTTLNIVPGSDAPASDAPASDAPASDAPASDAPASDAPASDAPASDAPASDAPASDAPASDAPASDAPASDAPASDAPASDAPASDAKKDPKTNTKK